MDGASDGKVQATNDAACPHLGTSDDPSGFYSYPSASNRCYHSEHPATPRLTHQQAFCLGGTEKDCPVYSQPRKKAFPSALEAVEAAHRRPLALLQIAVAIVIGVAAIGYATVRIGQRGFRLPAAHMPPAAAIPALSMTPLPTPTSSPVPTPTVIPTGTALPPERAHALEAPFEIDGRTLVMHRVGAGDMFDTIDSEYQTTSEVIRALNYSVKAFLLANTVIVIAPGLQTVDPALPAFKVRQVDRPEITVDELSLQYHVEAAVFRHYNGCSDACTFAAGDWILIPVIDDSTAAP